MMVLRNQNQTNMINEVIDVKNNEDYSIEVQEIMIEKVEDFFGM